MHINFSIEFKISNAPYKILTSYLSKSSQKLFFYKQNHHNHQISNKQSSSLIQITHITTFDKLKMGIPCSCFTNYQEENIIQIEVEEHNIKKQLNNKFIINLQSVLRGYMDRKKNQNYHTKPAPLTLKERSLTVEDLSIENYLNEITKKVYKKIGQFKYNSNLSISDIKNKKSLYFSNGAVYVGETKNLFKHGRGMQAWLDGSIYEGHWENDKAYGIGRLIHADGDIYEGEWSNDKANGYGTYTHTDGAVYQGDWLEDKQHGDGYETWPDGARYQGSYKFGKKHGLGKFFWLDGSTYDGEFVENNIEGFGIYKWSDGRVYTGFWKSNKMDGKGYFSWPDGRNYDGEYFNDKKHGLGTFKWPDGKVYIGMWAHGKQNGKGTFYSKSGKKTTYKPKDILGYGYEETEEDDLGIEETNWVHYERAKVDYPPKPFGPKTVFMQREEEGSVSEYSCFKDERNTKEEL